VSIFSTRNRVVNDDIQQPLASGQEELDRRKLLRRLTGIGATAVGAIAVTWADAPAALAFDQGCCGLATRTPCGGSWNNDGHFTCPSGHSKHYWPCTTPGGHFVFHCWECDKGSSCYGYDFKCSNYWSIYIG